MSTSLCAGSVTAFSLYAPLFQSRLHYTQYQVNLVSIAVELALYLPVPIAGYACDRYGPRKPALFSAVFFGGCYTAAAFIYRSGPPADTGKGNGWPVGVMVAAFVGVGWATSSMYLASLTTCAKNFGRGKHKGFAMAAPIASFGLSGMWQSQVGSRLLCERNPDGSRGDVDVFRYFLFLAGLLFGVGVIGFMVLHVVDEEELIDEAVEEMERSGLLEESDLFHRQNEGYGAVATPGQESHMSVASDRKRHEEEEARKKKLLLNSETHRFLTDPTMWWLAAGFFLVSGPGDSFINNLGTIIGTLYPPPSDPLSSPALAPTSPATHVSIVAITSTVARLLSGFVSDLLSPTPNPHQHRRGPGSLTASLASLDPMVQSTASWGSFSRRFTISRMIFLLLVALCLSLGFALLASGAVQNHAHPIFGVVSALVGTGYGAIFSLVPIIISCVWGVENFGTNWGILAVVPAAAGPLWGVIYAANYSSGQPGGATGDSKCYGTGCYSQTFWGMAVASWIAMALWVYAWKGPGGWSSRHIAV